MLIVSQTFYVEVNENYCHVRKKCFTRKEYDPVPERYPAMSRSDEEENFRRFMSTFTGAELGTTEEKHTSTE